MSSGIAYRLLPWVTWLQTQAGKSLLYLAVVLGDVHQVVRLGELRQVVEFDLGHVRAVAGRERGGQLGVERAAGAVGRRRLDGDPGVFLLEIRDHALGVSGPGPPGEGDFLMCPLLVAAEPPLLHAARAKAAAEATAHALTRPNFFSLIRSCLPSRPVMVTRQPACG